MLPFREIKITDQQAIEEKFALEPEQMTERCFTDVFIWRCRYRTEFCIQGDFLYMMSIPKKEQEYLVYLFPVGKGDRRAAMKAIADDAAERGKLYKIFACTALQKEELERLMPGRYEFTEDRDSEDYIYESEPLMTLKGKKLHAKRNYINRFLQNYEGRWSYEVIDPAVHKKELMDFHHLWCQNHDPSSEDTVVFESCAVWQALENFEALRMRGGILRIDGNITAFTLGCPTGLDTFTVQIEKALADIDGAYPLINRQFIQTSASEFQFINREEDMGIPGLRTAKLSYQPVKLTPKFIVEPKQ